MKPEDVNPEWVLAAHDAYRAKRRAIYAPTVGGDPVCFAAALAAVAPLIAAAERERCARVVEQFQREVQNNIDDNIAEVRVVEIKPSDNWPLIKARDWLKHTAAAIRALP